MPGFLHNLPLPLLSPAPGSAHNFQELLKRSGYGTYTGLTGPIAHAVLFFLLLVYSTVGSFGLGIILAAVLVRLLLLNLTVAQIRTMRVNQYLMPLQKKIQERYRGDKQTQNQLLMQVYQKFKLNPLAGCLGMLIQLPIFFGIYRALYDPVFLGHSFLGMQLLFPMNLYYARNLGGQTDLGKIIFDYIAQHNMSSQVWQWSLQFGGRVYEWALYWPALLLVALYIASSLWMQRVMKRVSDPDPELKAVLEAAENKKPRNPGEKKPPDLAEQMQRNMRFMTIALVLIAFILSAGALLYFFVQNLLMIAEYTLIPRSLKLAFSAADVNETLELIEKGKPLVASPQGSPDAEQPAEPAQAPLRRRESRGFKKKK